MSCKEHKVSKMLSKAIVDLALSKQLLWGSFVLTLTQVHVNFLLQTMVQLFYTLCFIWFGTSMFIWPAQMSLLDCQFLQSRLVGTGPNGPDNRKYEYK